MIDVLATLAAMTAAALLLTPLWPPPSRRPGAPTTVEARPRWTSRQVTLRADTLATAAVCLATLVVLVTVAPVVGVVAVIGVGMTGHRLRGRRELALRQRRDAALPELVDALVALVHAGLTPPQAWRALPKSCPPVLTAPVEAVIARMDSGAVFSDALRGLEVDIGPAAHALVDTLQSTDRYGLPLGPVLQRLSADAASHRRRTVEARARQLPVRLSFPLVLFTLPSFVVLAVAPVIITALSSLPR